MKIISIFNTAICSNNTGDFIIMDSVNKELQELFPNDMIYQSITHDKISTTTYRLNKTSDYSFIGGTNLLSSNMNKYNQWKINLIDSLFLNNIILLGVGWWQYQKKPNIYTRYLLKSVLSSNILHSVRDSYTEEMLKNIGINNVINTGCPTMWALTTEHCKSIPTKKSDNVIFTLTDYNINRDEDLKLINILLKNYKNIYFWPQGEGDYKYIKSFGEIIKKINILGGNNWSYNKLLENKDLEIDFVGTRLHAGIRALQYKRRSIIIGIDNRAIEKSKDFNLKVLPRENINELEEIINNDFKTEIILNEENIKIWKNQFNK